MSLLLTIFHQHYLMWSRIPAPFGQNRKMVRVKRRLLTGDVNHRDVRPFVEAENELGLGYLRSMADRDIIRKDPLTGHRTAKTTENLIIFARPT